MEEPERFCPGTGARPAGHRRPKRAATRDDQQPPLPAERPTCYETGTIDTAREAGRSIVGLETLRHTSQQLMESLDEVLRISNRGNPKSAEAEAELGRIEGSELKQNCRPCRT
ncbi:MAG: toxic anion resistance protein [Evtepia gabavorous]